MSAPVAPAPVARNTRELCAVAEVGDDAKKLLGEGNPEQQAFVDTLVQNELFDDAVRLIAHALPRREAVWWSWVCARKASGASPPPPIKDSLDATEKWIVQPTEEHRRQAMASAEVAEFGTAAGCAGLAAFMSTGSISLPDAPVVPPPEFMTAKAVSVSVTLSAVATEPERAPEKYAEYIRIGLEVAERTKLWPKASPSSPT